MARATAAIRFALLLILAVTSCPTFADAQAAGARGAQPESSTGGELVLVKENGTPKQYHRSGCDLVRDGKGVLAMTRGQAESRGYKAHPDCDPSTASGKAAAAAAGGGAVPPVEPNVVIDAPGKYYHRENCPRSVDRRRRSR